MKGDLKAAIIAEYERSRAGARVIARALGVGSYDYVSYVLRIYRGEPDPREALNLLAGDEKHLAAIAMSRTAFPVLNILPAHRINNL